MLTKLDQIIIMYIMLLAGVIMVCFAAPFADALYLPYQMGNHVIGHDDERLKITLVFHSLGIMVFIAGLVERLVIAISPAPASRPRNAWSLPDRTNTIKSDSGSGSGSA